MFNLISNTNLKRYFVNQKIWLSLLAGILMANQLDAQSSCPNVFCTDSVGIPNVFACCDTSPSPASIDGQPLNCVAGTCEVPANVAPAYSYPSASARLNNQILVANNFETRSWQPVPVTDFALPSNTFLSPPCPQCLPAGRRRLWRPAIGSQLFRRR